MGLEAISAAFLDRDGTVIVDTGYVSRAEDVRVLPGAAEAIGRLNRAAVPVVMVTNQSGIGRGLMSEGAFRAVQAALEEALSARGARLDAVYHCPHASGEGCPCRKPAGGLFERAAEQHGLDLARGLYVGDRWRDVAFGLSRGGRGVLVGKGGAGGREHPRLARAADLAAAIDGVATRDGHGGPRGA